MLVRLFRRVARVGSPMQDILVSAFGYFDVMSGVRVVAIGSDASKNAACFPLAGTTRNPLAISTSQHFF
jgi:hypothetical protein